MRVPPSASVACVNLAELNSWLGFGRGAGHSAGLEAPHGPAEQALAFLLCQEPRQPPRQSGKRATLDRRGFELGLTGRITSAWSVMGGYAYQHGVITSAQASTVSGGVAAAKGATLAELPKNNFSLWNRYNINQTWGAGLGIITRGPMYAAIDNKTQLPGFARVDAAVYAKINKDVKVQLNIENLFDTQYYASAHNNNNIMPGSPIAIRLSVTSNF